MNSPMYRNIQKKSYQQSNPGQGQSEFSMSKVYLNVKTLQKLVSTELSVLSRDRLKQLKQDIIDLRTSIDHDLSDHTVPDHVMDAYDDACAEIPEKLHELDRWILK